MREIARLVDWERQRQLFRGLVGHTARRKDLANCEPETLIRDVSLVLMVNTYALLRAD